MAKRRTSIRESDEARFERFTCYVGDCIIWTGAVDRDGYGMFTGGGYWKAHRFAYYLRYGHIPAGLVINHLCRNHGCVNPAHLELVTHIENILHPDSLAVTNINALKKQCPRGHAFKTYKRTNGRLRRYCPVCAARNQAIRKRKHKQVKVTA